MATKDFTAQPNFVGNMIYTWPGLALNDDGAPVGTTAGTGDRSVQVTGTFGAGGTVLIEGTLDMSNWFTLRDPFGSLLSFSTQGLRGVMENVVAVRPRVSAGDGTTNVAVTISVRKVFNA